MLNARFWSEPFRQMRWAPNERSAQMRKPRFWSQPFRYMRWASHERPALFYPLVIGCIGPIMIPIVPPIRARFGDGPRELIPLTYPSKHVRLCWCCTWDWELEIISPRIGAGED